MMVMRLAAVLLVLLGTQAPARALGLPTEPAPGGRSFWDWSMPENVSSTGEKVDELYWLITYICGAVFVITQVLLVFFIFRYRARAGGKSRHVHGSVLAELTWTFVPGAILVWLALHQSKLWDETKRDLPSEDDPDVVVVQVLAQQYNWSFRYRGPAMDKDFEKVVMERAPFGTKWDLYSNKLYVPLGKKVVFHVSSRDVVHSFFLPHFRIKQDAVPGLSVRGWFDTAALAEKVARGERNLAEGGEEFDIVCSELCGPQHYKMANKVVVLSPADFAAKMKKLVDDRNDKLLDDPDDNSLTGRDPQDPTPGDTGRKWKNYKMPAESQKAQREYLKTLPAAPVKTASKE